MVKYILLGGLWFYMDEMFFYRYLLFKGTLMLLGNFHLMDKNEVRIVITYFYSEDGVSSSETKGFKMIYEK
jgi:hypothetical protein